MHNTSKKHKLRIAPEIFMDHPDYAALVIYAENIVNGESDHRTVSVLRNAEDLARSAFAGRELSDDPRIVAWREAFREFGAKPKKYLCGAEALIHRVLSGESIPAINLIVDLYNAISIKYAIPAGGEDWDTITSDLTLIKSAGTEPFATMTSQGEQIDVPREGEIIWADVSGVTVRRWNWRQCYRTRVTTNTTRAYFVLDRLEPMEIDTLISAGEELSAHLRALGPKVSISKRILTANG